MAEIKMDITEYEALKRIETDLRESLKKQESLNEEIKKLQQEKIEAAELNSKKVSIVKTTVNTTWTSGIESLTNHQCYRIGVLMQDRKDEELKIKIQDFLTKNSKEHTTNYKEVEYVGFEEVKEQIRAEEAKKVGLEFEEVKKLREIKLDYQAFTDLQKELSQTKEELKTAISSKISAARNLESKLDSYKKLVKEAEELLSTVKAEARNSWFNSISWNTKKLLDKYVTVEEKIKKIEEAKKLESEMSL